VTQRISLGCALLAILLAACQQRVVLDDLGPDAGQPGTGGITGGGKGGVGPSDASADGHCFGNLGPPIVATADRPFVLVALDRSSEMTGTQLVDSDNSEFNDAVTDLSAQVGSYAPSAQHVSRRAIDFAYLEFPEGTDCATPGCCASIGDPADSYQAFVDATMTCDSATNTCGPSTNHPIAAALSSAQDFFNFGAGSGGQAEERYVLLVTDDAPDGNCSGTQNDCQAAQGQVYALSSNLNVTTIVVYVGTAPNSSCFQNLAEVQGGGPPPYYGDSSLYYNPSTADDLQKKIATVILAMAQGACRFTLSSVPSEPSDLTVSQGTMSIPPDSRNGWTYDTQTGGPRLILRGSACSNYLMSQFGGLQVSDGCVSNHVAPNP
jgi:hypothetical protein